MTQDQRTGPEYTPAMRTSIERLDTLTLQLTDSHYGRPVEVLTPGQGNPSAREIDFSAGAIAEANLGEHVKDARAVDSPPYDLEGSRRPHTVRFFVHSDDGELEKDHVVTLTRQPDGTITVQVQDDIYPSGMADEDWDRIAQEEEAPTLSEVWQFLKIRAEETDRNLFSQAECDKLISLVLEERKLRGLAS